MKISKIFFTIIILILISYVKVCFAEEPILVIDPQGHSSMIRDVIFTPDGTTLISVSEDKSIRLWDVTTGELMKTIRGQIGTGSEGELYAGALSRDGKVLAVGGKIKKNSIRIIHLDNYEQIGLLKGHKSSISDLAFSQDGKLLASGSLDNTVRIWDVAKKKTIYTLKGHTDHITSISFSPDGRKLVSASCDNTLRLWNLDKYDKLSYIVMKKHNGEVFKVKFAPNGRFIVSGGFDGKIVLWDSTGKLIKEIDTCSNDISTISFSPNSDKIVVFDTGTLQAYVYTIPSGKKILTFTKHTNAIVASAFYSNDLIATAGGVTDHRVKKNNFSCA